MPDQPPEYLSIAHAAQMVDVSVKTVRRWIALPDDPLPAYRLGSKQIRISRLALLAWIERRRAVSPATAIVDEIIARVLGGAPARRAAPRSIDRHRRERRGPR